MDHQKLNFIREEMFVLLNNLHTDSPAQWGKMNARQMVEHIRDFFNVSIEKIKFELVTPEEDLPKYRSFLFSDKEFRENTKAPGHVLGDEPLAIRFASLDIAIDKLKLTVEAFVRYFAEIPDRQTTHPVFGILNEEEWVLLHYKHVRHHLRQFGLIA
jgi:hypothetical protein